jgi:hypothetical protein
MFRFASKGDSGVYFASTTHDGVAYFTSPFTGADVRGDAAGITVYDTTSADIRIHTRGHHIIVFAAEGRTRTVAEVYWLENDGNLTRVPRADTGSWEATVPERAANIRVDDGDVAASLVQIRGNRIAIRAPISPGLRQLQFSYNLPVSGFPLTLSVLDTTTVLEVMVEDQAARVTGAEFVAQPPVEMDRRGFQRFLAHDVPGGVTFTIAPSRASASWRTTYYLAVLVLVGAALLLGFARAALRPARANPTGSAAARQMSANETTRLAHAIATLDARFERLRSPGAEQREAYETQRRALVQRLNEQLAARDDRL